MNFQQMILTLQQFWAEQNCIIVQPYDTEKGAGTMNPMTYLRSIGPEPWNVAYVEPSVARLTAVMEEPEPSVSASPISGHFESLHRTIFKSFIWRLGVLASIRSIMTSVLLRTIGKRRRLVHGALAGKFGWMVWKLRSLRTSSRLAASMQVQSL